MCCISIPWCGCAMHNKPKELSEGKSGQAPSSGLSEHDERSASSARGAAIVRVQAELSAFEPCGRDFLTAHNKKTAAYSSGCICICNHINISIIRIFSGIFGSPVFGSIMNLLCLPRFLDKLLRERFEINRVHIIIAEVFLRRCRIKLRIPVV